MRLPVVGMLKAAMVGEIFEEVRQNISLLDLHEEVDVWVAFLQIVDGLLVADHTAHECDQQVIAPGLSMFELGELVMRLLFWCFAHAAGIEHHQVSLVHAGLFPAQSFEDGLDALGVSLVHLAANGPDVIFPPCNTGGRGHVFAPLRVRALVIRSR